MNRNIADIVAGQRTYFESGATRGADFRLAALEKLYQALKQNEPRQLEMLLEDTIRHLQYRFLGREQKKIRKMGTFRTLKFACQLGTSEGFTFTDGTVFYIWISDDRNLIPLYIESPVRVGSIQAYLSGYRGLKYPLESKIK